MADPERLAGYDEDGTGRATEFPPLQSRPDAPSSAVARAVIEPVVGRLETTAIVLIVAISF